MSDQERMNGDGWALRGIWIFLILLLAPTMVSAHKICDGGETIRYDGKIVGCVFHGATQAQLSQCNGIAILEPQGQFATCHVCIRKDLVPVVRQCPQDILEPSSFACLTGRHDLWPPIKPPEGLIAWWPFEGSGTAVPDVAGIHDGVASGPTRVGPGTLFFPDPDHGVVGKALRFDGRDDHVEIPVGATALAQASPGLTLEGWIHTQDTTNVPSIFDNRSRPFSGYSFYIYQGALGVQVASGGQWNNLNSSAFVADGQWHHVAVTLDSIPFGPQVQAEATFYVDGQRRDARSAAGILPGSNSGVARIGGRTVDQHSGWFEGGIDELSLYSRLLTSDEIRRLAGARRGKCEAALGF